MSIVGTSEYMSPELKYNKIQIGLTFLEVLTLDSVENFYCSNSALSEKLKYLE